ncbi:MAG: FlgK family flagellar hook-associated protein [Hasllibacter sp.]
MPISQALSSAASGLAAARQAAHVAADNVANASTPGYGRRNLELSVSVLGGVGAGVRVQGVQRAGDEALASDIRGTEARLADGRARSDALARLAAAVGSPADPGSLSSRLSSLDTALRDAAAAPADAGRLNAAVSALGAVADGLVAASAAGATQREAADARIASDVDRLNRALIEVADLNAQITRARSSGRDHASLTDRRSQVIASVADIVPLRGLEREGGRLALITGNGRTILDGPAPTLRFAPAATIDPAMTVGGALSHVTIDGRPLTEGPEGGSLGGGSLGAAFAIRDDIAPALQSDLDAIAADLAERFGPAGADPGILAGMPGLLTDAGAPVVAGAGPGLAGRIAVHAGLEGNAWRLRDGIAAAGPDAAPSGLLLLAHADRLTAATTAPPHARVTALLAGIARMDGAAEGDIASAAAERSALLEADSPNRVDLDAEMSELIRIEHLFDANAKVLETIDAMLRRLTEI